MDRSVVEERVGLVSTVHHTSRQAGVVHQSWSVPHAEPCPERAAQPFHESLPGLDIDDSAAAFRVIFGRRVGNQLDLLDGRAVAALQIRLQVRTGHIGRPAVYPHRHSGAVELDIAFVVHGHTRRALEHIEGVTGLCHGKFRHVKHQTVELVLDQRPLP